MSGIKRIQEAREKEAQKWGSDLWLKNGDQAFVACAATGGDNDPNGKLLGQVFVHTKKIDKDDGSEGYAFEVCRKHLETPQPCSLCENGNKPQHRFAMWVYVYHILHNYKKGDWEATTTPSGGVVYKDVVNSFKMFSLGFGKGDNTWNQVCAIYEDQGSLAKNVIRVKRTGEKLGTSYTITSLSKEVVLDKETKEAIQELPSVEDYFLGKIGEKDEAKEEEVIEKTTPLLRITTNKKTPVKVSKVEEVEVDFGEALEEDVPF